MPGYPSAASPTRARKSGIKTGSTPNFSRTPSASQILLTSAVNLHYPVAADALRQVLVGCPDADLLHTLIYGGDLGRGGKRVVSLQLGHGPYSHTHSGECFFERVELREQRGLDAIPCFVAGPETVPKGLDDVIGRDTDVSCSRLDHLQHCIQYADHGAEGPILALGEAAKAVKVAEQLVRAVYEMNDHAFVTAVHTRQRVRLGPRPSFPSGGRITEFFCELLVRTLDRFLKIPILLLADLYVHFAPGWSTDRSDNPRYRASRQRP